MPRFEPNSRISKFQHKQIIKYQTPNTIDILKYNRYSNTECSFPGWA